MKERFPITSPYDLKASFRLLSLGSGDPTLRLDDGSVQLAFAGPEGPVAVCGSVEDDDLVVKLTGAGCEWLVPHLPGLFGLDFEVPQFAEPRRLATISRRHAGLRLPRLPLLFPRLVQIILQQLINFQDACYGWKKLVQRFGTPLEGPARLAAPPTSETLARVASYEFVECGILPQHGRRIVGAARIAKRLESLWNQGADVAVMDEVSQLLAVQRGIGPWTIGYLRGSAMGDRDAVVLGDYGFPAQVSYFFEGKEKATDEEMLALLEPFRPHRFYVLCLLLLGAPSPPRRGPRGQRLRNRLGYRSR